MSGTRRVTSALLLFALAVLGGAAATACASSPGAARPARGQAGLITALELESSGAFNVYDAVKRLRPLFLNSRGAVSINDVNAPTVPLVYVDNRLLGRLDELRSLSTAGVVAIRLISGPDATLRWGPGHGAGVIHVQYAPN